MPRPEGKSAGRRCGSRLLRLRCSRPGRRALHHRFHAPGELLHDTLRAAALLKDYFAVAINKPCGREAVDSCLVEIVAFHQHREGVLLLFQEVLHFGNRVFGVNRQKHHFRVVLVLLVELLDFGQLHLARTAPRPPEVDDGVFALERIRGDRLAVDEVVAAG